MNIKIALAVTMLFGSLAGGVIAGSAPGPDTFDAFADDALEVAMARCAGGYHTDAFGNCETDDGIVDSRCPAGLEASPFPSNGGYRCVPIPQGY